MHVSRQKHRSSLAVALLALAVIAGAADAASPLESRCARQLGGAASRLAGVMSKGHVDCHLAIVAGEGSGPCPTAEANEGIDKARLRLESRASLSCQSLCSLSAEVPCIADDLCPTSPALGIAETCTAGASNRPFDMGRIGFPGPFCEAALDRPLRTSADIAECVESLTADASEALANAVLGDPAPVSISQAAFVCQRTLARRTRRLAMTIQRTNTTCRNDILRGILLANPADCALVDPRIGLRTADVETKLRAGIEQTCTDLSVTQLNLCGAGIGAITSADDAADCLVEAAHEIAYSVAPPSLRMHSPTSLLDAAYPPEPGCGDGAINRGPDAFQPLGEECDGDDDAACPGACIPPGDVFECTCGDRPRMRFFIDSAETDIDQGWTGGADDTTVPDDSGFVIDLAECECTEMDGATCTGSAPDPICTISSADRPRCSWDGPTAPRCDARGNSNFLDEDGDCWICDAFSANAGDACNDEGDCDAICYDADDVAGAACPGGQVDCGEDEICRGRCDRGQTCVTRTLAPPIPVASNNASICIVQTLREDTSGTTNVVTGEHAIQQRTRVKIYGGVTLSVPCPVCGGFCEGGVFEGNVCLGSCASSGAACRFDTDCAPEDRCTPKSSDCPEGQCNLSLICRGGVNDGEPCRIEGETPQFGAVSSDCPPSVNNNHSGAGLVADYLPVTSEALSLPSSLPCTAPGYENFDCPCPDDGGRKTQPNACAPACNAGSELGVGCANGGNASGRFTVCAGGFNLGRACDEDADCPGSACSVNPTHCIGDPALEQVLCATNADCGIGVCANACPSGRCVPLCLPTLDDPEDGECAGGPAIHHCSGAHDDFRTCDAAQATAGCSAVCETSLTACDERADCPPNEACVGSCERRRSCEAGEDGMLGTVDDWVGAGDCVADLPSCPLEPLAAEGGDVFNSRGSPSSPRSVGVFCLGRTSSSAVNTVVGVGGPGRVRRSGSYVTNGFTDLD